MLKRILQIVISLLIITRLSAMTDLKEFQGIYVTKEDLNRDAKQVSRILLIEGSKAIFYNWDCNDSECKMQGDGNPQDDLILRKISRYKSIWLSQTIGFPEKKYRFMGFDRGKFFYAPLCGPGDPKVNSRPCPIWTWYAALPKYRAGLRKRLGLKAKTMADTSFGEAKYILPLPAKGTIETRSAKACKPLYYQPKAPWKQTACLKNKTRFVVKKALGEKIKNRWGDEGYMVYIVSDEGDGWILDTYLKLK